MILKYSCGPEELSGLSRNEPLGEERQCEFKCVIIDSTWIPESDLHPSNRIEVRCLDQAAGIFDNLYTVRLDSVKSGKEAPGDQKFGDVSGIPIASREQFRLLGSRPPIPNGCIGSKNVSGGLSQYNNSAVN